MECEGGVMVWEGGGVMVCGGRCDGEWREEGAMVCRGIEEDVKVCAWRDRGGCKGVWRD